ncbi:MAG: quinolinate synthase NadA [Planctomycetota bacterium]|nr:MAG: quinolinate synthase NadA [Planctomycetota bacterium]
MSPTAIPIPVLPQAQDVPEPAEIRRWASERGILILAHSYQDGFLQEAAHFVGDSLELARAAAREQAHAICFCGVHFMAETAKILNPAAEVFVPDLEAGCSLADSCRAEDLARYQDFLAGKLGRRPVTVAYINCTAGVKALSDVICTSGNAREVVDSIPAGEPVLFVPDQHLGAWVAEVTGRELILWNGSCIVHELFSVDTVRRLQEQHPGAVTLAHPECPKAVREAADQVLGTAGMLRVAREAQDQTFIVATESNMLYRLNKEAPQNMYIPAPGASCACNLCPHMQKNTPEKLWRALQARQPQIEVAPEVAARARRALERMLAVRPAAR